MMRPLRNWFRRQELESDLARELAYHLDRHVNELTQSGMTEVEARRQAALALGGMVQVREEVRDVWLTRWLRDFAYDLRFSMRSFLRNPSFSATVVLSLALGIGATTAIYSLVDQVVLRSLPVQAPEQLVLLDWIGEQAAEGRGSYNIMSYPMCRALQQQERFFDGVLCRHATQVNLSTGNEARPAGAEIVSGNYFRVLGVTPALGRLLGEEDDGPAGSNPVVILSHDFWKTQMGSTPDVVGSKVLVNNYAMTVVGVAPPEFRGIDVGEVPAVWIPVSMAAQATPGWNPLQERRTRWMQILGRLRNDVSLSQAQSGLQPWFNAMLQEDSQREGFPLLSPERREKFFASTLTLTPSPQGHSPMRRLLSRPLWVLLSATALLLGLACLNVAGLFLARASARDREITTRVALGASRGRVGRQMLADSLVFALAGGSLGVILAPLALRSLIAFLPTDAAGNNLHSQIDAQVLLFTIAISVTAGLLSGLGPALQMGRTSLIASLRERGSTLGGVRLRKLIVTVQIAFTLLLVLCAALFVRTLAGLWDKGPGFSTSSLISFKIEPRRNGYNAEAAARLTERLHDDIRNLPITQSATVAAMAMLEGGSWNNVLTVETPERVITERTVHLNSVTPSFFATLGVKIIAGRGFDERDTIPQENSRGVRTIIINESFARRYFKKGSPIGARLAVSRAPDAKPNIEIVGVAADISYRGIREESEQAYFPMQKGSDGGRHFYLRVHGSPEAAFQSIRTAIRAADPTLPIAYFRTLDEQVSRSLSTERMLAAVSVAFGGLALALSLVGLYGVMSFVVTQRTREIGVRLALGATRASALWLVLRDAVRMIAMGTMLALPSQWALGRLVENQLYGVKPTDGLTILAATLLLMITGLGAALIPAYRASSIDPTAALRSD